MDRWIGILGMAASVVSVWFALSERRRARRAERALGMFLAAILNQAIGVAEQARQAALIKNPDCFRELSTRVDGLKSFADSLVRNIERYGEASSRGVK
jgi:hypothetical protein